MNKDPIHAFGEVLWPPKRNKSSIIKSNTVTAATLNVERLLHTQHDNQQQQQQHSASPSNASSKCLRSDISAALDTISRANDLFSIPSVAVRAERRRIEEIRRMEEEWNAEEERRRRSLLVAQEASTREHDAAVRIQKMFYAIVVRGVVGKRRERDRHPDEDDGDDDEIAVRRMEAARMIQRVFRGYSVCSYFEQHAISFVSISRPSVSSHRDIIAKRVTSDFHNRLVYGRRALIHKLSQGRLFLDKSVTFQKAWLSERECEVKQRRNVLQQRVDSGDEGREGMVKRNNSRYLMDLQDSLLELVSMHRRYITSALYESSLERSGKATEGLHAMERISIGVRKLLTFVQQRVDSAHQVGVVYYQKWLLDQQRKMTHILVSFDTNQELLLERELRRVSGESSACEQSFNLLKRMMHLTRMEDCYSSEKLASDVACLRAGRGNDEALKFVERIEALNEKLRHLRDETLPPLQEELERTYKAIDENINTNANTSVDEQEERVPNSKNCMESDWMDLFYSQPWVATQTAEESRLEAFNERRLRDLDSKRMELNRERGRLAFDEEQAVKTTTMIAAFEDELSEHTPLFKRKEIMNSIDTLRRPLDRFNAEKHERYQYIEQTESAINDEEKTLLSERKTADERRSKQNDAIRQFNERELKNEMEIQTHLEKEREWLDREHRSLFPSIQHPKMAMANQGRGSGRRRSIFAAFAVTNSHAPSQPQPPTTQPKPKLTLQARPRNKTRFESYHKRKNDYDRQKASFDDVTKKRERIFMKVKRQVDEEIAQRDLKELQQHIRVKRDKLKNNLGLNVTKPTDQTIVQWETDNVKLPAQQITEAKAQMKTTKSSKMKSAQHVLPEVAFKAPSVKQLLPFKRAQSIDIEESRMMQTIRKRMMLQGRQVSAACRIQITVGQEETNNFHKDNLQRQSKGIRPHFRKIRGEIGTHDRIALWICHTTDQRHFITDLRVADPIVGHPQFINLKGKGYEMTSHPRMKGEGADPAMCLWHRKDDKASQVLSDIAISYSRKDEQQLLKEGFKQITPVDMTHFGLGDTHMWIKTIDRKALPPVKDLAKMTKELNDYTQMLKQSPKDPILKNMVDQIRIRLKDAQIEEEDRQNYHNPDPVQSTIEFLALDPQDVTKFQSIYSKIDQDHDGFISIDEFAKYIGEQINMRTYTEHIFVLSHGNKPTDDRLDFSMIFKAVCTFNMLAPKDILKFVFSLYDHHGYGVIKNDDFLQILTMLHPHHRGRTMRALREFDLNTGDDGDGTLDFRCFCEWNARFPNLLYPAFHAQDRIKKAFLGNKFWENKSRRFKEAKEKVKKEMELAESVANEYDARVQLTTAGLE